MSIRIVETNTPEETFALGESLGREAVPGQVCTLIGDLGVGKTVFTQGMARGLGITGPVNSPTFTVLQVYEEGRLPFYHFDVYRLSCEEEMDDIGYEEYFFGDGVCLVEWAELFPDLIPKEAIWLTVEKDFAKGEDYRRITLRQEVEP